MTSDARVVLASLAVVVLGGCAAFERRAPDSRRSISQIERITLGGLPQTIRIRGDDRAANPVLLFVHGGPGLPEMPVAQRNADLESIFTIVQWDQRGAGKSFRFDTPDMHAAQFVEDTLELSRALRRRFGGRKIYLAGYSWGSLIAARAVAREPELFAAYIGISQLVNIHQSVHQPRRKSPGITHKIGLRLLDLPGLHLDSGRYMDSNWGAGWRAATVRPISPPKRVRAFRGASG